MNFKLLHIFLIKNLNYIKSDNVNVCTDHFENCLHYFVLLNDMGKTKANPKIRRRLP